MAALHQPPPNSHSVGPSLSPCMGVSQQQLVCPKLPPHPQGSHGVRGWDLHRVIPEALSP